MKIVIDNDKIENWDNYSIEEKRTILYTLTLLTNLKYERLRLITSEKDVLSNDTDSLKESASFIGKEIVWPTKGIITGIEETYEDYYYIVQTELDTDYITLCANLKFKDNE